MSRVAQTVLAVACLFGVAWAQAAPSQVKVARLEVRFAEEGWEAVEVNLGNVNLDPAKTNSRIGIDGQLEGRAKVLTLRNAERQPVAVLMVFATFGAARNIVSRGECPPFKGLYVRDFTNKRLESPECVLMAGPVPAEIALRGAAKLRTAREQVPFELPPQGYVVDAFFANSTGESVHVQGLLSTGLKGVGGRTPGADVPGAMPPEVAAWGDALGDAVRKAMRTLSGDVVMPPVSFY